ncbi:hypothetical protein E2C01_082207 [Portunus trituberculatus]|uniref:Uncharacterized protein n=1 Tax=Portunus trituberculatus TaxID=210409 RepID=A0A5B7J0Z4_PORTR|nr:hypothetical protein [Portunus trituberculatus]
MLDSACWSAVHGSSARCVDVSRCLPTSPSPASQCTRPAGTLESSWSLPSGPSSTCVPPRSECRPERHAITTTITSTPLPVSSSPRRPVRHCSLPYITSATPSPSRASLWRRERERGRERKGELVRKRAFISCVLLMLA